jgi:hypothetical protein
MYQMNVKGQGQNLSTKDDSAKICSKPFTKAILQHYRYTKMHLKETESECAYWILVA